MRSAAGGVVKIATSSSRSQRSDALEVLLEIARDLTASLGSLDRYERLLSAVRRVLPFDAACLLRLQGDELVPLAAHGLVPGALERPYPRHQHPRLDAILKATSPIHFPPDSPLPDPFDGLLTADPHALERIHACLGCPLTSDGEVVGALTADALHPGAFDGLDTRLLATLGALAGAALRTATLIEVLEKRAERGTRVARELQRSADETSGAAILGTGPAVAALLAEISVVAASNLPVLVTGETGVGKELVARHVHAGSRRRDEALIHVNCAALPESIAESELFGHVAGSFTGAVRDRAGKFEVADGGSLFLDEVGELPLTLQPKLLRALQQGEIQRIGSDRLHRVDVRIIAATNRDLVAEVERGRFRADLYHRLAVYPIRVPSLRERREDIPILATHFADTARRRLGLGPLRLGEEVRARLAAADWPGNVRELENVVSRAVLRAAAGKPQGALIVVTLAHVDVAPGSAQEEPARATTPPLSGGPLRDQVDEFQRRLIREAVERHGGNQAAAARELGMHRANLHHLARRLGIRG
jgi:anaerobic nitric oxide reductase transcription regulator